MAMTDEMKQMLEVIKEHDSSIVSPKFKRYIAPDISDKIAEKLIKNIDSNISINNIVAFYDITYLNRGTEGFIFTTDGMYERFVDVSATNEYIRYCDMEYITTKYDEKKKYWDVWIHLDGEENIYKMKHRSYILDGNAFKDMLYKLRAIDRIHGLSDFKVTGAVKEQPMSKEMWTACHGIIHAAAAGAGAAGAGLAQFAGSDNAVIVPIQITMITSIGSQVFGLDITEAAAKSIIASAGATIAGRATSQFLVGWIPGIGNVINTATAAGITELIGWIAVDNFYYRYLEDQKKGKLAGMKAGYEQASAEYEKKLKKQAEEFLKQKDNVEIMVKEYESLLDEYEKHIQKLEAENVSLQRIAELKGELEDLKALKKVC